MFVLILLIIRRLSPLLCTKTWAHKNKNTLKSWSKQYCHWVVKVRPYASTGAFKNMWKSICCRANPTQLGKTCKFYHNLFRINRTRCWMDQPNISAKSLIIISTPTAIMASTSWPSIWRQPTFKSWDGWSCAVSKHGTSCCNALQISSISTGLKSWDLRVWAAPNCILIDRGQCGRIYARMCWNAS